MLTRRITKCIPIPHPAAAAPPFAHPACWVPAVKSPRRRRRSNTSQRRLPAVSRARTQDSSPTPGPVQAFVHNSIQNIFPFVLCASVTVTPANAYAVAAAALFILLAGACGPPIFNTLPRMLTWRDELSAGWWPMRRCHSNETSLADVLPRPESNRSASWSWKGNWWPFNIEDFMPTWGDAPTAEEFWYCVVFLLALGVLRRLYIYVRELCPKGQGKKVSS